MKKFLFVAFAIIFCFAQFAAAQIPVTTSVQIVRAEDERRFDQTLEKLLGNADAKIRARAALAAGRIGDERAILSLTNLLRDDSVEVQMMAIFALGEIESPNASKTIAGILNDSANVSLRARALEAAGKIAAASPKDAATPELKKAIISALNYELSRNDTPNYETVLLGETAVLRARPEGGEELMSRLLKAANPRIRADALNTLARLRSQNVNEESRQLLQKDSDPIVRAGAARMLGIGNDNSAVNLLSNVVAFDVDSRVRISAIRSLGNFKDENATQKLLERGEKLFADFRKSSFANPSEKSELLEILFALGKILANTKNERAIKLLTEFRQADFYYSPETEIALARITPQNYFSEYVAKILENFLSLDRQTAKKIDWHFGSTTSQALVEILSSENVKLDKKELNQITNYYETTLSFGIKNIEDVSKKNNLKINWQNVPDIMQAYAKLKTPNGAEIFRQLLVSNKDVFVRAAAAQILAEMPASEENVETLKSAFTKSLLTDKHENDAQLAILDALAKLDKKSAVGTFLIALDAPDYLIRKKAFAVLADEDLQKDFPGISASLENAKAKKENQLLPYAAYTGTKLGQILNSQTDYIRAVSRKNGGVKAVLTTTKGDFTIDFFPEDAPLTVDNFVKLARAGYFNGLEIHRVVPNFVMQDGDPRGDGNGGPGWEIRCEINMLPYERGAVGMALSGKDTGGSQWFVTHSPQPHLDGGYTVFGRVNETDMKIVDSIVRGDKILSVRIIENNSKNLYKR